MMSTNKVKDPPHLGFSQAIVEASIKNNNKLSLVLKKFENILNIYTSTPKFKPKFETVMDISFSKCYQYVTAQIDNDSGYMSLNHESNSGPVLEGFSLNGEMILSDPKSLYLSEDALLERPEVESRQAVLEPVDQKISGSYERIEASVSSESEHFSVLRESSESGVSDLSEASAVIPKVNPIIITDKSASTIDFCDISNDSNIENNINIVNTSSSSINSSISSRHCGATKSFDSEDKQNILCTSTKHLNNKSLKPFCSSTTKPATFLRPLSPELFSDDEVVEEKVDVCNKSFICEEKYILKQDKKLIKNVQSTLSGVLPPPSLTSINLTAEQILEKIEANKHLFWADNFTSSKNEIQDNSSIKKNENNKHTETRKCLLLTTSNLECLDKPFPEIMEERYHGLHYNRSKLSEEFEMLCMKYLGRYIGCETQSTCTVFQQMFLSSPLKRKANRLRWVVKSPGRRLSHLARRRITFSSANLQASAGLSSLNAHTRQIAIDSKRFQLLSRKRSPLKKSPRKTPRKSPRKSPRKKIRTPTSSAKKRLSLQLQSISSQSLLGGLSTSVRATATKRALFQSPEKVSGSLSKSLLPSTSGTSSLSPFKKRVTPKCALFTSPSRKIDNKRKRTDSDDIHPSKLFRSVSLQEGGNNGTTVKREVPKFKSDTNLSASQYSGELSAHHRKKLQWAVYEALRGQNIGINHPQFKQFASVLARVTRRFLPNLAANAPRPEGGTSDRMLRIARQHIFAVMKGKSVDEIIQDFEVNRLKNAKPIGYIGLDAARNDTSFAKNKENVFRDRLNTLSNEKRKSGLNRDELIKTTLTKFENRIDRARRMINFDDENKSGVR